MGALRSIMAAWVRSEVKNTRNIPSCGKWKKTNYSVCQDFHTNQYCSWRCWENICRSTIVKLPDPKACNWKRLQKRTFGTKNAAVCKNAKFADHCSLTEFGSFLDRLMIWNILPIPKMIQKCHLASVHYWKLKNGNDILFPKGILISKSEVWKS